MNCFRREKNLKKEAYIQNTVKNLSAERTSNFLRVSFPFHVLVEAAGKNHGKNLKKDIQVAL